MHNKPHPKMPKFENCTVYGEDDDDNFDLCRGRRKLYKCIDPLPFIQKLPSTTSKFCQNGHECPALIDNLPNDID